MSLDSVYGIPPKPYVSTPTQLPDIKDVVAVTLDYNADSELLTGQVFFLKRDGTLWTAGANGVGQLGIGSSANQSSPVQMFWRDANNKPTVPLTVASLATQLVSSSLVVMQAGP